MTDESEPASTADPSTAAERPAVAEPPAAAEPPTAAGGPSAAEPPTAAGAPGAAEPPTAAGARSAAEPRIAAGPPGAAESATATEVPTRDPDAPDRIGRAAGTVLAFRSRPRRDAAGRASPDTAGSHSAGRVSSTRSGYDVDNEPVVADATLTGGTEFAARADLAGGARTGSIRTGSALTGSAVLTEDDDETGDDDGRSGDWAWVEEWRAGHEPVPWASGLGLAAFGALVVGVAIWVLSAGLAGSPVLAIGVNLLVAGGLAPAMWLSRGLPVLRWIALGSAVGVLAGWVCALAMLPLPTP